jgi:hypothetical protein
MIAAVNSVAVISPRTLKICQQCFNDYRMNTYGDKVFINVTTEGNATDNGISSNHTIPTLYFQYGLSFPADPLSAGQTLESLFIIYYKVYYH